MILDVQLEALGLRTKPDPGAGRPGMTDHIVERFLNDAIPVDTGGAVDTRSAARAFVRNGDADLLFERRNVPFEGAFETRFIQDRRVQCLREAAHVAERR